MSKKFPQRKSLRLKGYDYTQSGAYFVTICTHRRYLWFGDVVDAAMVYTDVGEMAIERWLALPEHYSYVELDMYVVMPNHMHGIILINKSSAENDIATSVTISTHKKGLQAGSLGVIIGTYKASVKRTLRRQQSHMDDTLWQTGFHEHIIRDEAGLNRLRRYILINPKKWEEDKFYRETK